MSRDRAINNRRLLEAIEYLDSKYIDEMFDDLKVTHRTESPDTRRTPFKYWKQFVALAACLILLSVASPLVSYIAEVISNFAAGAGSGTDNISDTLEIPDTTEELVSDFDPNYVLTEEDLARFEVTIKKVFNKKEVDLSIYHFYGKCGDSIIYWNDVWSCDYNEIIIEDYLFTTPHGETIRVQNGESVYTLEEAYEKGIVTYADIIQINKVHLRFSGFSGGHIGDNTIIPSFE